VLNNLSLGRRRLTGYAVILRICLIPANTCPTGAVPDQHHAVVSELFSIPNPCGDIKRILAGHTPISTAAHSLSQQRVFLYISYAMHASIDRDRCESTFS
jgi:hypothetical protein